MTSRTFVQKGVRFVIVGTIGFLTDAGILWFVTNRMGIDPYSGRLLSFATALMITWLLNSRFTFKSKEKRTKRQFSAYVTVQVSSFGLNYAVYSALVWLGVVSPIISLAIASVMAMFYSFTAINFWVFKDGPK